MGTTIRRSVGDTDLLVYELRDKELYEDRSHPVNLKDKRVYMTMVNSCLEIPSVPLKYIFESEGDRDQYFTAYPEELSEGLIIVVRQTCMVWRGSVWNNEYWAIIRDKECIVVNENKGYAGYRFTNEEVCRSGMFHVYFTVISYLYNVEDAYIFHDINECNAYFSDPDHAAELINGIIVSINYIYYEYDGSAWIEGDAVDTSSTKYPKGDSLWVHLMDVFTE